MVVFLLAKAERICYNDSLKSPEKEGGATMKYVCPLCGYVYDEKEGDPDNGIEPGTRWEDIPEDFECPLCGAGKDEFEEEPEEDEE